MSRDDDERRRRRTMPKRRARRRSRANRGASAANARQEAPAIGYGGSCDGDSDREDLAEKASEFLLGVLERMGISADIDIKEDTDKTVLEIQTARHRAGDRPARRRDRRAPAPGQQGRVQGAARREDASRSSSTPAASATSRSSACAGSRRRWARRRCRRSRSSSCSRCRRTIAASSTWRSPRSRGCRAAARVRAKIATSSSCPAAAE